MKNIIYPIINKNYKKYLDIIILMLTFVSWKIPKHNFAKYLVNMLIVLYCDQRYDSYDLIDY